MCSHCQVINRLRALLAEFQARESAKGQVKCGCGHASLPPKDLQQQKEDDAHETSGKYSGFSLRQKGISIAKRHSAVLQSKYLAKEYKDDRYETSVLPSRNVMRFRQTTSRCSTNYNQV